MKVFFLLSFLFVLSLTSCYEPQRVCKDYHTGDFIFEYEVDGTKKSSNFTRTDKYSIEHYENKIDTATVRWLNDCEFVLSPSDNKTPIHYKILATTEDSYTFEYNVVGKKIKSKGTATKTH